MMTHRNLVRDGMTLPISEALQSLQDDKGNKISFQLVSNPLNGELPKYYYEDRENKKVYSLSVIPPYDLVTLRVGDMTAEQRQQRPQSQQAQKKSKK